MHSTAPRLAQDLVFGGIIACIAVTRLCTSQHECFVKHTQALQSILQAFVVPLEYSVKATTFQWYADMVLLHHVLVIHCSVGR